jgi:multidrug efflux system membrane fusion protein
VKIMRLSQHPVSTRIAALALLGLALGVSACGPSTPVPEAPAATAAPGGLAVTSRAIADMKPVAGEVTTRDMGMATARIGGTLVRLTVREGATVRAGQVIGVVRDDRINLQTAGYDAMVRAAEAEAERARADLTRTRTLFDRGIYAQARLDQVAAAAHAAEGNLEAARAQRAASAESGAQGAILAPTAGRVLKADVPLGSVVMPGQSIATVTSGPLVVRVQLPEGQARALQVGTRVEMTPDGPGGDVMMAAVSQVYPAVDAGQVVADIDASGLDASLIGRRIGVRLPVGERQAIVIPATYVVTRFGVDYVRLVRDGTVADTPVQLAPGPLLHEVEVLSGLVAGDRIVAPAGTAR